MGEKSALEICKSKEFFEKKKAEESEKYYVVAYVKKKSGKHMAVKKAAQKLFSANRTDSMFICAVFLGKDADDKKDSKLLMFKNNQTTFDEKEYETSYTGVWNQEKVS